MSGTRRVSVATPEVLEAENGSVSCYASDGLQGSGVGAVDRNRQVAAWKAKGSRRSSTPGSLCEPPDAPAGRNRQLQRKVSKSDTPGPVRRHELPGDTPMLSASLT